MASCAAKRNKGASTSDHIRKAHNGVLIAACVGLFANFLQRARKALKREALQHETTKECFRVLNRIHDDEAALLQSIFPTHIANQLKTGQKVAPREHKCVTIMFSDIVGFTALARVQEPVEVSAQNIIYPPTIHHLLH